MRATVFTDRALARHAGRFVWLSIDAENDKNAAFVEAYPWEAVPTFEVIDPRTERVVYRWLGAVDVAQLEERFGEAERAMRDAQGTDADRAYARAIQLDAEEKRSDAVVAYDEALRAGGPGWPARGRAAEALVFALSRTERNEACATRAIAISDAPPRLADAEAAINEEGFEFRDGKWFDIEADKALDYLPEHVRIKAAVAMAEATINFKRIGSKGQYIEAFMPFFNASVQATYRQYQQLKGLRSLGKKDIEGMRAKRYLVYLSALASTGVLYWLLRGDDDDWPEQDAYLRDGDWAWGANGKTYVRIPKPRDTAVVSNVVENMLDAWYHEDARSTGNEGEGRKFDLGVDIKKAVVLILHIAGTTNHAEESAMATRPRRPTVGTGALTDSDSLKPLPSLISTLASTYLTASSGPGWIRPGRSSTLSTYQARPAS